MIIDAHTHLGEDVVVGAAEDLVRSMDEAEVSASLVFAGRLNQMPTERVIEIAREYPGRLYPVGSVSFPESVYGMNDYVRVRRWLEEGAIHGLKFYTGYEHYYPSDSAVAPYLELLRSVGRPAIFHAGDTYSGVYKAKLKYAHPIHIDDVATDFPGTNFIIAHLGYPWQVDAAEVVYKNKNVYADCSGFVYENFTEDQERHFAEVVEQFCQISAAPDRILFGTDWPISSQKSYARVFEQIYKSSSFFSSEHHAAIFSENARRLFGIK